MFIVNFDKLGTLLNDNNVVIIPVGDVAIAFPKSAKAEAILRDIGNLRNSHFWSFNNEKIGIVRRKCGYAVHINTTSVAEFDDPEKIAQIISHITTTSPVVMRTQQRLFANPYFATWSYTSKSGESWWMVAAGRITLHQQDWLERNGWIVDKSVRFACQNYQLVIRASTGLSSWPVEVDVASSLRTETLFFPSVHELNDWADKYLARALSVIR